MVLVMHYLVAIAFIVCELEAYFRGACGHILDFLLF